MVGAGFGGIAAAIELQQPRHRRRHDPRRAPEVGGTWFHNSYPGAACDVPSHLYSYSFAQRSDWSRLCSPQSGDPGVPAGRRPRVRRRRAARPEHEGDGAPARQATRTWTVETEDGRTYEGDAVVLATGQLNTPAIPGIPGVEEFAGRDLPLRALGPRRRPARRSGGGGRDRRQRRAVRAGDRARGRAADGLPAHAATGSCPGRTAPTRGRCGRRSGCPAAGLAAVLLQGLPRDADVMIRHPWTVGTARARVLVAVHAPPAARPGGAAQGVARLHLRVQADPVQLAVPARARARRTSRWSPRRSPGSCPRASAPPTARCTRWTADLGHRVQDHRVHVPDGRRGRGGRTLAEEWADGAHAHLGMTVPGLPVAVRAVRAEHEHLGRFDHRLPRGPGRLRAPGAAGDRPPRRRGARGPPRRRGGQRREAPGRVRGHGLDAVRLLVPRRVGPHRGQLAGLHEEYVRAVRQLDPAEFDFPAVARELSTGSVHTGDRTTAV